MADENEYCGEQDCKGEEYVLRRVKIWSGPGGLP